VTQMYFDGEPLNEQDRFLQSVLPDRRVLLIAKLLPPPAGLEPDSRLVVFDIVTLKG
jgi:protocatechuate 3,4-dioxygenase, beta subunit